MLIARPKVSVLMSVHNGEKHLATAMESVMSQTMENFEFVVIDDGSTDSTPEIVNSFALNPRVKVLQNEKRMGIANALNRGLEVASGKYIARLDADDSCMPQRLDFQSKIMDEDDSLEMVAGLCTIMDSEGRCLHVHKTPTTDTVLKWLMIFRNPIMNSTVMWRNEGQRYDPHFTCSQDYEMWSRMKKIRIANRTVSAARVHPGSISSAKSKEQDDMALLVTKRNFERYIGDNLDRGRARDIRLMCVHRNQFQNERIREISEGELVMALEDYKKLIIGFIGAEKPDIAVLKGEIVAGAKSLVLMEPRLESVVSEQLFGGQGLP